MNVHLNHAGAGPASPHIVTAVADYLRRESEQGSYELEAEFAEVFDDEVYRLVARLLNANISDIAIFGSATAGWLASVQAIPLTPTDEVWVSPYEYAGNLIALAQLRRRVGFTMRTIPLDAHGDLDLDWMDSNITEHLALVSVPHVPSGCGIINPVEAIGQLLTDSRTFFVVDGCQAVGQVAVDVAAIGCDVYTGAGRKFLRGPRGTGFAATSARFRQATDHQYRDLHVASTTPMPLAETILHDNSARGWEIAERNPATIYGLTLALREHFAVTPAPYTTNNGDLLRTQLSTLLPQNRFVDPGTNKSNIVTIDTAPVPPAHVVEELRSAGFNTWVMTGADTPTYMSSRHIEKGVRISPHYDTAREDIAAFCHLFASTIE